MLEQNPSNINRTVKEGNLEIADTFQDAGTRPIAESPNFLVSEQENADNSNQPSVSPKKTARKINRHPPLD